jgi:hypothetical protein
MIRAGCCVWAGCGLWCVRSPQEACHCHSAWSQSPGLLYQWEYWSSLSMKRPCNTMRYEQVYPPEAISVPPCACLGVARALASVSAAALSACRSPRGSRPHRVSPAACRRPTARPLHGVRRGGHMPGPGGCQGRRASRPQTRAPAGAGWQGVGGRARGRRCEKWLYFSYPLYCVWGRAGEMFRLVRCRDGNRKPRDAKLGLDGAQSAPPTTAQRLSCFTGGRTKAYAEAIRSRRLSGVCQV